MSGVCAAIFAGLAMGGNDDGHLHGSAAFFASGVGGAMFSPIMFLVCIIGGGRAAMVAFGDLKAIVATPEGLVVHTMWGTKTIAWASFARVEVQRVRIRLWFGYDRLAIRTYGGILGGKTAHVTAHLADLPPGGLPAVIAELDALRRSEGRTVAGPAGHVRPAEAASTPATDFDADAAIQRYLRRKAEEEGGGGFGQPEMAGYSHADAPLRPQLRAGFGRKGL
jgi:hypothetical protein